MLLFGLVLEVFISLLKRAEYYILKNPLSGFEAWYQYNKRALSFIKNHRDICTLCHIHAIIQNPEDFFKIINENFNLKIYTKFEQVFDPNVFSMIAIPEWCERILNEKFPKLTKLYKEINEIADLPIDFNEKDTNTNEDILYAFGTMIQSITGKYLRLSDELSELQKEHHQTKAMLNNLQKSIPVKVAKFTRLKRLGRFFKK